MPRRRLAQTLLTWYVGGLGLGVWAQEAPTAAHTHDTPVLRMLLSPRMPWALPEWPRMQRLAQEHGLQVQTWRDPRVPPSEWLAATHAAGLPELAHIPALDEAQAAAQGLLHHAPSSLVGRCTWATPSAASTCRWHPWPILGVMPDAAWVALLQHRLNQL